MKNIFFIAAFLLTSLLVTAQTSTESVEKELETTTNSLKITMHFKDLADLKRFNEKDLFEIAFLEKLEIKPSFSFAYTLGEAVTLPNSDTEVYNMKVEIKDHNNKEALFKEIKDSIDGIIEIYEAK